MAIKPKLVTFKLIEETTQKVKDKGDVKMTWGSVKLSATYNVRDINGILSTKVISVSEAIHPKSGVKVPVPINGIEFTNGYLNLLEGRDQHLINALRESVNNVNSPNRFPSDKAIFYELDPTKEKFKQVDLNDLIAEAYIMIGQSEIEELIEYAKAIGGIDTDEIEALLSKAKTKEQKTALKSAASYKLLVKEMKSVASKDPGNFVERFSDPIRPFLSSVRDALNKNVIGYNPPERSFHWKQGNSTTTFVRVPQGRTDATTWLAEWFMDPSNQATYNEMIVGLKAVNIK